MILTVEQLQQRPGVDCVVRTKTEAFAGRYEGTIPTNPQRPSRRNTPRLVIKGKCRVSYVEVPEVCEVEIDA